MKTDLVVTLYGEATNNAVVRLPGRKNVGVVIQSDTLQGLLGSVSEVLQLIKNGETDEATDELDFLRDRLLEMRDGIVAELAAVGEAMK